MKPIRQLAHDLANGLTTAREQVEQSLQLIEEPAGEGRTAFIAVSADRARAEADFYDAQRAAGRPVPLFAGIPVGIKDLADVAGEVTTAGSVVLADQPPAGGDAVAVARLRAAGFIAMGRTNMTEFAYSGLGLNAHYGTPASPWGRDTPRIPGGSSSGTAVAVADGMVAAGLGTDTGGSCRIPAAYCGIVGYKPTQARVPLDGIFPLSSSLDSVGPLAATVDCCAVVDDIFAGGAGAVDETQRPLHRLRLAALANYVTEDLDSVVGERYERAVNALAKAGAHIESVRFGELDSLPEVNRAGGLAAPEAYAIHRELLAHDGDRFDTRVRPRIETGSEMSAAQYIELLATRRRYIEAAERTMDGFDCFVLPTVANLPPTIDSFGFEGDPGYMANYRALNNLSLRNTAVGNFLDGCAITLPIAGDEPVGLMLMSTTGRDRDLFSIARAVEGIVANI